MARFAFKAGEEYALKLSALGKHTEAIAKKAVYAAANIVADEMRKNIQALPAVHDKYNLVAYRKGAKSKLSIAQKRGLLDSFGVAEFARDEKGFYNVKLGFDEYNSVKTKKYQKGQPNQLVARVLESGSSYMDAVPFVRRTIRTTKAEAQEKMQQVIDEEARKLMG